MENAMEVFDLLRGDAEYKQRVGVREQVDRAYIRDSGLSGAVLGLKNAIKH
jgi:CelD/BcsL family acetyltransferase involved in cellulose biosynthesis